MTTIAEAADKAAFMLGIRLGNYLTEHLEQEWDITLRQEQWEMVGDEELAVIYEGEDTEGLTVMRHIASGACFEVAVEPTARPVPTKEELAARKDLAGKAARLMAEWRGEQAS